MSALRYSLAFVGSPDDWCQWSRAKVIEIMMNSHKRKVGVVRVI